MPRRCLALFPPQRRLMEPKSGNRRTVAPLTIKKKPKVHINLRTLQGPAKSQQEREASEGQLKKKGNPLSEDEIDDALKNAKEQHEQARKTFKDKLRKLQDSAEKKSQSNSRLTRD